MNSSPMIQVCAGSGADWTRRYRGLRPCFACVLSYTETALIDGISAAGTTAESRKMTAAADGAFLAMGAASNLRLPRLSAGVSPAVISRAILQPLAIPTRLLCTGLPVELAATHIALPTVIAKAVPTGMAMPVDVVKSLITAGLDWGQRLAQPDSYLIISECVVGGTTTAQAVLEALGYDVAGYMGSSHARGNHAQKRELVRQGLARASRYQTKCNTKRQAPARLGTCRFASAFDVLAAVGDPMQAVVAGMLISASRTGGVLLAGGSQMLAVYAFAQALAEQRKIDWQPEQIAVGTTRWLIEDASADTAAIARQLGVSYLASQIDFSESPYVQLRAYERGFVKEGVGAGGCAIAAHLYKGWNRSQLRHAVEAQLRLI